MIRYCRFILISIVCLLSGTFLYAQSSDTVFVFDTPVIIEEEPNFDSDKTFMDTKAFLYFTGNRNGREIPKKPRFLILGSHWSGISFGYTGLISGLGNFSLPGNAGYLRQMANSPNFNLNLIGLELVSTRPFALVTGIGMEFSNIRFRDEITLVRNAGGNTVADDSYKRPGVKVKKSKLSWNYFNIPLLAEFRINKYHDSSRAFYLYGGVLGGWGYNTHTKIKYSENGKMHKEKNNDLNIPNFRWGYTVGIGFSHFGIYATYYPKSLFKADRGPDVKQFNMGVSFNIANIR